MSSPGRKRSISGRSMHPETKGAMIEANRTPEADQPYCRDTPGPWVDYTEIPKANIAREMCQPCPLKELCLLNAKRTHPAWGVWGGVAWVYGKPTVDLRAYSLDTPERHV